MSRLKWGLIGASTIAHQRVIGAIRECGGEVTCVFSQSSARGQSYAAANNIPRAVTALDELLHGVEAVYVSTTNDRHRDHVVASARAGRHVLCEKPLATSLDDTSAMIAACRTAGVVLATNHHLRSNAVHIAMKAMIADGAIGRPLFARVFNSGYLPKELQGWRLKEGVTLDKLVHDADTLRFVLDEEPVGVCASSQNSGMAAPYIEDGIMGVIRFDSGLLANFHDAFTTPSGLTGLEILGTTGSLIGSNCLTGRAIGDLAHRTPTGEVVIQLHHRNPYAGVITAFHAAIRGEQSPDATGEDGQRAVAVALAAIEAARQRREIAIEGPAP